MLAQPLDSSEIVFSQLSAAVFGEPCDEVSHSRVEGNHFDLVWCPGSQIALTQVGSHSFEGDAEVVLVVPQCQLGVPVGVGYWFPLFQWSQEGVIDAPVAEGGCVDENGLAGILPGAETCSRIGLLFSDALALVGGKFPVEFLDRADRQAGLSDGVALHLIGSGLGPFGETG